ARARRVVARLRPAGRPQTPARGRRPPIGTRGARDRAREEATPKAARSPARAVGPLGELGGCLPLGPRPARNAARDLLRHRGPVRGQEAALAPEGGPGLYRYADRPGLPSLPAPGRPRDVLHHRPLPRLP